MWLIYPDRPDYQQYFCGRLIIDRVEMKDMSNTDDIPVLDLSKLGIAPEHYEAVEKAVKELERQGFAVKIIK